MKRIPEINIAAALAAACAILCFAGSAMAYNCTVTDAAGAGAMSLPYMAIVGRECGPAECPAEPRKIVPCDIIDFDPQLGAIDVPLSVPVRRGQVIDGKGAVTLSGNLPGKSILNLNNGVATVKGITVKHQGETAIAIPGHENTIEGCRVTDSDVGIFVSGHFNKITKTLFSNIAVEAISLNPDASGNDLLAAPSNLTSRLIDANSWDISGTVPTGTVAVELYSDAGIALVPQGSAFIGAPDAAANINANAFQVIVDARHSTQGRYTLLAYDAKRNTSEFSAVIVPTESDLDGDGKSGGADNCPLVANPNQEDADGDGIGDVCEGDRDGDGAVDDIDNCQADPNKDQLDTDGDGIGNACDDDDDDDGTLDVDEAAQGTLPLDPDTDKDGYCDGPLTGFAGARCLANDNCPVNTNADQKNSDADASGDACDDDDDNDGYSDLQEIPVLGMLPDDPDTDGDGICDGPGVAKDNGCPDGSLNSPDNCPLTMNHGQEDSDKDGVGDACEAIDSDGDGLINDVDNCPFAPNIDQKDMDGDDKGDACDDDIDGDGILNPADNCPFIDNKSQTDTDIDDVGDLCDDDIDGDGVVNAMDNCYLVVNPNQDDLDADGIGDACDGDEDGDGIGDEADKCPSDKTNQCLAEPAPDAAPPDPAAAAGGAANIDLGGSGCALVQMASQPGGAGAAIMFMFAASYIMIRRRRSNGADR